jgi:GTP-binding protein
MLAFRGLERVPPIDEAQAGDIVAIAGLKGDRRRHLLRSVGDRADGSAADRSADLSMTFRVNDSPLAGTEGDKVTSRVIRDRLLREAEGNVASASPNRRQGRVRGRRPRRIAARRADRDHAPRRLRAWRVAPARRDAEGRRNGETLEPIEEVVIDVDDEHSGVVVQKISERKAR